MPDTATLLKRHKAWKKGRKKLYKMENKGEIPSSSQWQNSDDEGVQIGEEAIELLRQPIKIWTCAVKSPEHPNVVAFVCNTEDECFEELRERYDEEDLADDEPPVAIVAHLEDAGYLINVDVHEVAR